MLDLETFVSSRGLPAETTARGSLISQMSESLKSGIVLLLELKGMDDSSGAENHITSLSGVEGVPSFNWRGAYLGNLADRQHAVIDPSASFAAISEAVALACWFKELPWWGQYPGFPDSNRAMFSLSPTSGPENSLGLYLGGHVSANGRPLGYMHSGGTHRSFLPTLSTDPKWTTTADNGGVIIADNNWHFFAFSHRKDVTYICKLDHIVRQQETSHAGNITSPNGVGRIGLTVPHAAHLNYWNGYLACIAVWNRDLTLAELEEYENLTRSKKFMEL